MATPSAEELTRLRRKTGNKIPDGGTDADTAFTDAELTDIWDEVSGSMSAAVAEVLYELIVNAARFHDYTRGQTEEKRSQIFDNLKAAYQTAQERLTASNQAQIVGMRPVPPVYKELPTGEVHPDEKNRRHSNLLLRRYRNWWG